MLPDGASALQSSWLPFRPGLMESFYFDIRSVPSYHQVLCPLLRTDSFPDSSSSSHSWPHGALK